MKCQIDLKSLLIGVLLAACVFMAVGASRPSSPRLPARYRLVPVAFQAEPYVVDGQTGRVWRKSSRMKEFEEMAISTKATARDKR